MHASSSCVVMSSIPLLLTCCNDSDDVGTDDGKVIEAGGDITLTIGCMVVVEGAMAKETIGGGEHRFGIVAIVVVVVAQSILLYLSLKGTSTNIHTNNTTRNIMKSCANVIVQTIKNLFFLSSSDSSMSHLCI